MIKKKIVNNRYPHYVEISRYLANDNPFDEEEEDIVVLYKGIGRVFSDTTTTGSETMSKNRRKCSIPVCFDEWSEEILDGDTISVKVGVIEYKGVVRDIEPDNLRTLIYWERPRVTD